MYRKKIDQELLQIVSFIRKEEHILDLGCGVGRNALFLLKVGFSVTGCDNDCISLRELYINAKGFGEKLVLVNEDVTIFMARSTRKIYALIIISQVLNYIPDEEVESILTQAQAITRIDGYNYIKAYCDVDRPGFICSIKREEISKIYKDWELIDEKTISIEKGFGFSLLFRKIGDD